MDRTEVGGHTGHSLVLRSALAGLALSCKGRLNFLFHYFGSLAMFPTVDLGAWKEQKGTHRQAPPPTHEVSLHLLP